MPRTAIFGFRPAHFAKIFRKKKALRVISSADREIFILGFWRMMGRKRRREY